MGTHLHSDRGQLQVLQVAESPMNESPPPACSAVQHGGRDRHFCVGVASIKPLVARLEAAGIKFTMSMSGRPAMFFRDPDMNCLEVVEVESWR